MLKTNQLIRLSNFSTNITIKLLFVIYDFILTPEIILITQEIIFIHC